VAAGMAGRCSLPVLVLTAPCSMSSRRDGRG
jgi:hypothetical protein